MTQTRERIIAATPKAGADVLCPKDSSASGKRWRSLRAKAGSALFWPALLVFCVLLQAGGDNCWGEQKSPTKLLFLVARPSILDPLFEKSVILMLPLSGQSFVAGLIVNKPTRIPVLKLFPESRALKKRGDNAYMGGPVDTTSPALVFHASKPFKQAMLLYDDVYVSFDLKFIEARLRDSKQTGDLRLFLGCALWAPEQLQAEAFRGSWYSLRAEGEVMFEKDAEHLWQRLHERARPRSNVENFMPQFFQGQSQMRNLINFTEPDWPRRLRVSN